MKQYIVDAFTDKLFSGNQAAICVLDKWISEDLMKNIAKENNFSETAFVVKEDLITYRLRWFTPTSEIDFCGHATLGAAYVLFRFYEKDRDCIIFKTQRGKFHVEKYKDFFTMDFKVYRRIPRKVTKEMEESIGAKVLEAYIDRDLMLVLENEESVEMLKPDFEKIKKLEGTLLIVTAQANNKNYDCVSRVFAPRIGIDEDPVTGSAHCMIGPYWCRKLKKRDLMCYQASQRQGIMHILYTKQRVKISGKVCLYSISEILNDLNI